MVTIISYKKSTSTERKDFISLKVQGGVSAIQSKQTGRMYLTAQTAFVPSTFDETTAKALIGNSIPGMVKRVPSEPYEYTIKETGEVVTLNHRYEYMPEEANNTPSKVLYLEEGFESTTGESLFL